MDSQSGHARRIAAALAGKPADCIRERQGTHVSTETVSASAIEVRVVYDGACPLCRACVRRLRSRSAEVRFTLIDARADPAERESLAARGFDLNDGIVMEAKGTQYSGAAAVHALARLQRHSGLAQRLAIWCFSSPRRAERFYPLFKACRGILLFVLNRRPL